MATTTATRRLAAILAADVVGYSRLMGADEEGTHERVKAHLRELVDPKITEHHGRIVKNTGDGLLAEFPSVVDAVRCAVEVQRGLIDREPDLPEERRLRFRIGVNLGVMLERIEQAAKLMGLGSVGQVEAPTVEALRALRPAVFSGASAVIVVGSGMFWNYRQYIVSLVKKARLPAIYPEREYADDGGLMVYGANVADNFRRAAEYVDRILKGAKPGDLPIQEPVAFDFIVNLKTARELDLTLPPAILARATEVIE